VETRRHKKIEADFFKNIWFNTVLTRKQIYENLDFFTLLQKKIFKSIYFSKYDHCSSFPNRGDLQIDMKKRRHNLRFT
jgi:hypothetical protein